MEIARKFVNLGFELIGTKGTAEFLNQNGIVSKSIFKVQEGRPNIVDSIKNGEVQIVINTPLGEGARYDENSIGWAAVQHKIPSLQLYLPLMQS